MKNKRENQRKEKKQDAPAAEPVQCPWQAWGCMAQPRTTSGRAAHSWGSLGWGWGKTEHTEHPWVLPLCRDVPAQGSCTQTHSRVAFLLPCFEQSLCPTGDSPSTTWAGFISCCVRSAPVYRLFEGMRLMRLPSLPTAVCQPLLLTHSYKRQRGNRRIKGTKSTQFWRKSATEEKRAQKWCPDGGKSRKNSLVILAAAKRAISHRQAS